MRLTLYAELSGIYQTTLIQDSFGFFPSQASFDTVHKCIQKLPFKINTLFDGWEGNMPGYCTSAAIFSQVTVQESTVSQ